ncbi:MAG TPA: ABC transporter permease, partial [Burkholderiaceae bacterium]
MPLPTPQSPQVRREDSPQGPCAVLHGRWDVANLGQRGTWRQLDAALRALPAGSTLAWDLRQIDLFDHMGAQLLWDSWGHAWPVQVELLPAQRSMLERVAHFTMAAPAAPHEGLLAHVNHLGAWVLAMRTHAISFVALIGQLLLDLLRLARAPMRGPWRDISGHLYSMGATALPITALVGFLIGVVLAYLTALQLRQFGAATFIVNILGIALIRELGPLLAAILVAGRSGSAITAQIGVMRVTDELDAMRVMGMSHSFRLVMPRALALAVAMPLVSVWTTLASLAGGMLAADLALGITPAYFM